MKSGSVILQFTAILLLFVTVSHSALVTEKNNIQEFFSLLESGNDFLHEEQLDSAAYYFDRSQAIAARLDTGAVYYDSVHISLADGYYNLGQHLRQARDFQLSRKFQIKALDLRLRFLPANDPRIGDSNYYLGLTSFILADYSTGMEKVKKSVEIRQNAFGIMHETVADSYNLLGTFHSITDQYDEAVAHYSKSLQIKKELFGEEAPTVASSYNNLGIVARQRGDYDAALEHFYKALAIRLATQGEEHRMTADNYMNIGVVFSSKQENEKAIEYYNKALDIRRKVFGDTDISIALTLNNMGVTYRNAGDYDTALDYFNESLQMRREILGDVHADIAQSLNNIGTVYKKTGDYDRAISYLNEAIDQRVEIFGSYSAHIADSYMYLGDVYLAMDEADNAILNYRHAIASLVPDFESVHEHASDHSLFDQAIISQSLLNAFARKAKTYHHLYDGSTDDLEPLYTSVEIYDAARHITDLLRNTYTAEQSKLFLSEFSSEIFENAVQTLFTLHERTGNQQYIEDAFSYAEHSRTLLLWESINDARARSYAGIPESVIHKERDLHQKVIQARMRYHRAKSDSDEMYELRADYFDVLNTYQNFIAELEDTYPRYYSLKHDISAPRIRDIQMMLDDNTAMLQYLTGEETSFVFVITADNISLLQLEAGSIISDLAKEVRRNIRLINTEGFIESSTSLYGALIQPAEEYIKSKERLIIIPDGTLHHVPFETLIATSAYTKYNGEIYSSLPYLINDYTITYSYSTKLTMHMLESERNNIAYDRQPKLAAFAPVFQSDEDTMTEYRLVTQSDDQTSRFSMQWFSELPYSEQEVKQIIELFDSDDRYAYGYFHSDATKDAFLQEIKEFSHIHIASHGFFNEDDPMLSGVLFAPSSDTDFDEERDILFAGEIYGLDLNSDLVVLSSCESGIGTIARGEGILALTRGFIHAGAHNLLVSLWKVTDRHTADLMHEFYRNVLNGENYRDALRNAKLSMIEKDDTALPMFWSGFVLIGV